MLVLFFVDWTICPDIKAFKLLTGASLGATAPLPCPICVCPIDKLMLYPGDEGYVAHEHRPMTDQFVIRLPISCFRLCSLHLTARVGEKILQLVGNEAFYTDGTEVPSEEQVEAVAKIQQFLNDELKLNGGKCKVEPNDRAAAGWVGRIPLKGDEAKLISKTYATLVEFATEYMGDEDKARVGDDLLEINSVTPFV